MTEQPSTARDAGARTLIRIGVLAAVYFAAGGLATALAPGPDSLVGIWPAAGLAVGALLLFGTGLWPGVFIGAVGVGCLIVPGGAGLLTSLAVIALLAGGATLQAVVASWCVRRVAGFPFRLQPPRSLLIAVALAGPVACLVSSTVAMLTLLVVGWIPTAALASSWLIWWIGDVLGIVLVLPLASEWRREMRSASLRARLTVAVPVCIGVFATVIGVATVRDGEKERAHDELEHRGIVMAHAVENALDAHFEIVHDLASVFATMGKVSPERFESLVADTFERHDDVQALGVNRVVSYEEIPALEREAREAGLAGFEVREQDGQGGLRRVRPHEGKHVVVFHIEPLEDNENARGYDIASNVDRRRGLQVVVDGARQAITPPVQLVQEKEGQKGFLHFVPIFRNQEPGTRPDPGTQPYAYAVGVFRAVDLVTRCLEKVQDQGIGYRILDTTDPARPAVLVPALNPRASTAAPPMTKPIEAADRTWTLEYWPAAAYATGGTWGRSWFTSTLGLLCTSLLGIFLLMLAGRTQATARRNEELRLRVEERIHAASRLRESATKLAEAQRIAQVGSWELDLRERTLTWSDELFRLLGLDPETDEADSERFLALVDPADREGMQADLEAAMQGGSLANREFRVHRPDGRTVHLRSYTASDHDDEGRTVRLVGTVQDVTERVRAQRERSEFEAQMQEAQKLESLGVLAGGIAHDFNNILTGVLGHTDLALEDVPAGTVMHRRLKGIESGAHRAADLCRQMLAYAGKGQFVLETLDLRSLVRDISQVLRISAAKRAELRYEFSSDTPLVRADATQLRQLVLNLITNASEALGDQQGVITVTTSRGTFAREELRGCYLGEELEPGDYACLEVTDTGSGMTPEVQERLFEPFFTTRFTGRGLGMAAVLGIVRAHEGCVCIQTEVGEGTRVRVLLPMVAGESASCSDGCAEGVEPATRGSILLVDDEPGVREVAAAMTESLGYRVIEAEDGEQALACFREEREDIVGVLLDLTMPGMDGKETFAALRRIDPSVRVILASGYSGSEVMSDTEGFAGFIQKPFLIKDLREALEHALGARV